MKFPFVLALLCLLCYCVNGQDKPSILIGTGGGITGMATVHRITPSGEVFRGKGVIEIKYTECGKIKRSEAKKMIAKVTAEVNSSTFDHPGNIYHFLSLKENDGEKKITWGDGDNEVPDNIKALYDEIQSAIADLTYKPIPETN